MRLWLTLVLWLGSSLVLTEESPPPSKRHKCPDAAPSKHLLCYHEGEISAGDVDPCVCTHVVLPTVDTPDGYRLDGNVGSSALSVLRARNPSLRLLLGVDATSRALYGASDKKVSDFARATADYIKRTNLDGLEVDLGEANDDTTHTKRKENVVSVFKSLRESMGHAKPKESDGGEDSILLLRLPVRPESLAKTYDLKPLSKYVDYFTVSTHNITDASERDVTYHHSRLMGLADILNTDSVLDMLTGLGAPPPKLIITLPTHALSFSLKNENENVARSPVAGVPKVINYEKVCSMMKEGGWTVERDEDLTAPYAFRNKTWIAFEDETSVTIKGKYALLRGLAGIAVSSIDADDRTGVCGRGSFPLTRVLKDTLTKLSRKPRGLILRSLEEELRGGVAVALPEASLDSTVRLSPFRIVRVVDREGAVHVIRRDSETRFQCSRQGYFRHPLGCNQFYRCVKFDQLTDDYSVFEYDCPPGLAFDEKWEVCVWPGQMSVPCDGSSEIAPVPRAKFTCPAEGYYADPENCRWFFACLDHHGDPSVAGRDATDPHSGLTAYEFRCPFGLAFDGSRLACEWPWIVPGCGKVEIGSGVLAAIQPVGYSLLGHGGAVTGGGAIHHVSHVDSGSIASVLGAGEALGGHIATGGAQIHHVESGSVATIFGAGDAGHIATGGAQLHLGGARFASGRAGLGSGGASYVSGGAGLVSGRAGLGSGGASYVSGGAGLVSGRAGLGSGGASYVSGGAGLVSGGASYVSGGAGLLSGGAGLLSGGAGLVSGGAGIVSGGAGLVSERVGLVSGRAGLGSGGASYVSGGAGLVSGGAGLVSQGAGLVTQGAGLVSQGAGLVSGGDGTLTGLISGGPGLASGGVQLVTGGAQLLSEGAQLVTGGAQLVSGGARLAHVRPVSGVESGSVASIFGGGDASGGGVVLGGEHLSLGGAGIALDGVDVASGGSLISSGGARGSFVSSGNGQGSFVSSGNGRGSFVSSGNGRGSYFSTEGGSGSHFSAGGARGTLLSSGGADISSGGAELSSGVAQIVSGGEKIVNSYSYQAPAVNYQASVPTVGVSYASGHAVPAGGVAFTAGNSVPAGRISFTSRPSFVTGVRAGPALVHPLKTIDAVGVTGVGVDVGDGRANVEGVEISGVGVSGIRVGGGGIGIHAIPSVAPSVVGVIRERPAATVVHSDYDEASKYTVSISSPSTTSRPLSLVKTNVYSTPTQFVTPAPIQYQSPQPVFLAHETYHGSAPATGSGTSSFSITTGSRSDGNLDSGSAFGSRQSTGSGAAGTGSGRSGYVFGQREGYQPGSYEPQYYYSSTGPSGSLSYSLDSSAPRTGAFVPVKPVVSSTVFTASERPILTQTPSPALDAARAAAAAGAEGGSVGGALSHGTLLSFDGGVAAKNLQEGIGFGLVRDDGHAVTGDGSSRPTLVGVEAGYQEPLRPVVTAPAAEFSYKELPLSIYEAAAPAAPARSFGVSRGSSIYQQAPQRVFTTTNVSPAPVVNLVDDRIRQSTFVTQSTTPAYEEVNVDIGRQAEDRGGFSYKNILPVVELSTPAPSIVSVPQVSLRNQGNPNRKVYSPVFTTTVAPPTAIGFDDADYGSRIVYTDRAKQPAAFASSRGTSGLLQFVQTESPSISFSPTLVKTTPVQQVHNVPVTPAPAVFVSTTPAPTLSGISYSTTPSTPTVPETPLYYVPARVSTRPRYFSTTTAAPIITGVFSDGHDLGQDVTFFEANRVTQNIPVTSTFAPAVVPSVLSLVPAFNDSGFGGRAIPTYRQPLLRGRGGVSSGDSDSEGPSPVSVSADVRASYGDRPSKRVRVDVLLKENDDEPQVSIETDAGKVDRGRYRYRARGGRVRVNGKKKCDDDEENGGNGDTNVDAILDGYSGSYGSVLSNGDKDTFIQSVISDDLIGKSGGVRVSGSGNDYEGSYRTSQGSNNPELTLGVTVKAPLDNGGFGRGRSRSRGRYQNENVNYRSNYRSSTVQPVDYSSGEVNGYVVSTVPTVVPVFTSTVGYADEGSYQTSGRNLEVGFDNVGLQGGISGGIIEGSVDSGASRRLSIGRQRAGLRTNGGIRGKSNSGISEFYSENSRKSSESGTDISSLDINHAAVIILPCGKLPALLAKLGAVTEGLRSIQQEEQSSTSLKITEERSRASLSLPPLTRYGHGDWNAIEKSLGNDACKRAGLFRHPQDCNRFYECFWDEWKGRYSLHEFKCPIRLAYDDSLSACNWPTSGPACSANKLLV